jgi:NAD(P)-dependent dehydrogenase (short-subunit alcohol dehydrogenase family)
MPLQSSWGQTPARCRARSPTWPTATELAKKALGEEGMKVFASMNPLQRMAEPGEIGAVAAFLTSQESSFMTASEVAVDGGLAQI